MKLILMATVILLYLPSNQEKIIDDFSSGTFKTQVTIIGKRQNVQQQAKNILGGTRSVMYKLGANPNDQQFSIQNNGSQLIVSQGYGVSGGVTLGYGGINKNQLDLDLTQYSYINIAISGKSGFSRVYLTCWSNGLNRAVWRGSGMNRDHWTGTANDAGHHKPYILKIPTAAILDVATLKGGDKKFKLSDVDALNFEFLGAQITGVNYAIDKIWLN